MSSTILAVALKRWCGVDVASELCRVFKCNHMKNRYASLHREGVTRRKQHRPGIAPNADKTHVPTAGSSVALTQTNHTPTRHPRARQNTSTNGHTPRRMGTCHVRIWQLSGKMQCLMPQQCKSAALEITLHMYLTLGSRETHALTPYACPSLINRKADSASWTFMVW